MGPVEKTLRKARQLIINRGWCQFIFEDYEGQFCVLGAIDACANGNAGGVALQARDTFAATVGDVPSDWNDDMLRKKRHVIAAFGLAIARAKRESK